jgi:hypothetical protein
MTRPGLASAATRFSSTVTGFERAFYGEDAGVETIRKMTPPAPTCRC